MLDREGLKFSTTATVAWQGEHVNNLLCSTSGDVIPARSQIAPPGYGVGGGAVAPSTATQ
jgi:hypothetical protein